MEVENKEKQVEEPLHPLFEASLGTDFENNVVLSAIIACEDEDLEEEVLETLEKRKKRRPRGRREREEESESDTTMMVPRVGVDEEKRREDGGGERGQRGRYRIQRRMGKKKSKIFDDSHPSSPDHPIDSSSTTLPNASSDGDTIGVSSHDVSDLSDVLEADSAVNALSFYMRVWKPSDSGDVDNKVVEGEAT